MLRSVIEAANGFVDLLVDEWNEPAILFYEGFGFARTEICCTVPPKRRMVLNPSGRTSPPMGGGF